MNIHENKVVESEMSDEAPIDVHQELLGGELMIWNIKAYPHPTLPIDIAMAIVALLPLSLTVFGFVADNGAPFHIVGPVVLCLVIFLWVKAGRQKNVYQYRITDLGGEVIYWADFPKHFGTFFKCVSGLFLFVVICAIAVNPAFIWLLAGPGGMAIAGARFFFGWENKKTHEVSFNWSRYNYVTVDRKRHMIIAHQTDLTVGFEAHLSKSLFNVYLETLRSVLPPTAIFTEASWKW